MATTTIPWGDGSGDKLYLTYPSASGDQTITVTSDANTGYDDRTISVTLTASHHGTSSIKVLTITQEGVPEAYIVFADPIVEQICATNWGDGVGLKPSQAAKVTNTQLGTTFRQNTQITSFDEFRYFTGITILQNYAFQGCSSLGSITFPSSLTTFKAQVIRDSGLSGTVTIPSSVTYLGNSTFNGCLRIQNLVIESTAVLDSRFTGTSADSTCGDGTGVLHHRGSMNNTSNYMLNFRKIIIDGNFSNTTNNVLRFLVTNGAGTFEAMKIGGNYSSAGTNAASSRPIQGNATFSNDAGQKFGFLEIMGTITSNYNILGYDNRNGIKSGFILHLGYDVVANNAFPCTPTIAGASFTRLAKIYVGKGKTATEDNAILAKYLSDSAWSAYSSKLDTWYNYVNDPNSNQYYIN